MLCPIALWQAAGPKTSGLSCLWEASISWESALFYFCPDTLPLEFWAQLSQSMPCVSASTAQIYASSIWSISPLHQQVKMQAVTMPWALVPPFWKGTEGSADVALENKHEPPERQLWKISLCTCVAHKTWWKVTTEKLSGRWEACCAEIYLEENTEHRKVSHVTVRLTCCIDFHLSLSCSTASLISGDWQYMYIFYSIRPVRLFSEDIKLLWYTSKA